MLFLNLNELNWLAIVLAALAFFGLAAIWYQPRVMGGRWMEATGVDPTGGGPNPWTYLGTLFGYFIMATVLAMIARATGGATFGDGLSLGLATGIAFVVAQTWINANYEGRSMTLVVANGGIGLIGHVVMAVIVTTWT